MLRRTIHVFLVSWLIVVLLCVGGYAADTKKKPAAVKASAEEKDATDKTAINSLPEVVAGAVDKAVKAEIERQQLVGVSIGVIQDGKIVYTQGYGFANLEEKIPAKTSTVFNWASNSKPMAALLAMQLVERGKLDLDEDVRVYVPEFPDKDVVITCRQLLAHQSGIVHYSNGKVIPTIRKYKESDPFADPINSLDKFNQSPLIAKPGEQYNYSSYAYILLSAAIQRAGKKPFNEQLEQRIVKPLELSSFQFDVPKEKRNWSMGYVKMGPDPVRTTDIAHYWKHGGGAFKSNVNDFARWAVALINRELVSEETEKKMWEPQKLNNGKLSNPIRSLGFVLGDGKRQKVFHEGKQNETRTRLVIYPGEKHGLVIMCNCDYAAIEPITKAIYEALGKYGKHEKGDG